MAAFWFILFLLAFLMDVIWILFMYSCAKYWPDTKEDFDELMQEIYKLLNEW